MSPRRPSSESGLHRLSAGEVNSSPALAPTEPNSLASCDVHVSTVRPGPKLAKCGSANTTPVQCPGDLFREARLTLGWSQERAAREYGAARLTIASWEQDRTEMPARALIWIQALAREALRTGT